MKRFAQMLVVCCASVAGTASAANEAAVGRYPVSWSAVLDLPSLADLDARLTRPFTEPVELSRAGLVTQAANCRDLLALRAQGYQAEGGERGYALERYEGGRCLTLSHLQTAHPARMSYLDQFRLDASALGVLPPTIATSFSTLEAVAEHQAESRGESLSRYQPGLQTRTEGDVLLVISSDVWESRVEIYARGDFDGDALEDLLVAVNETATQGTFESTKLLLLTRKRPRGLLQTLERLQ